MKNSWSPLLFILLGLLQGFLEWLPVSSSAQVMILSALLGYGLVESFEIAFSLHLASGLAALSYLYFRRSESAFPRADLRGGLENPWIKIAVSVFISFVVAYPLHLLTKKVLEGISLDIAMGIIGVLLLVTGLLMSRKNPRFKKNPSFSDLLIAGICQGFSILPGISRSGITFSVLLLLGVEKTSALLWSYYIGIPVVFAAGLYNILEIESYIRLSYILASSFAAFISGLASIGVMLEIAKKVEYSHLTISLGLLYVISSIALFIF